MIDGGDGFFVTRVQAVKLEPWKRRAHRVARGEQTGEADVDRGKNTRAALARLLGQKMHGLLAKAGAQLRHAVNRRGGDDFAGARFENRVLRAREIVLR